MTEAGGLKSDTIGLKGGGGDDGMVLPDSELVKGYPSRSVIGGGFVS
ncbi:MAG: hypothetical protein LBG24_08980 [Treponema sp.]|nr:hypothetical protein [Treponema sp.]